MPYTDDDTLNLVYGKVNVDRWADLNNDENDYEIDARRTWALALAEEIVDAELRFGSYEVPFSTVPEIIKYVTTLKAGLLLYEGRRITSDEQQNQLSAQSKTYRMMMGKILAGQIRLDATLQSKDYPFVPEE